MTHTQHLGLKFGLGFRLWGEGGGMGSNAYTLHEGFPNSGSRLCGPHNRASSTIVSYHISRGNVDP